MEPYQTAARILARVAQRRGSAKSLCLDPRVQQKRVVFKLVHETLRHQALIDGVTDAAGCAIAPGELARAATRLFAYDLLLGQGLRRRAGRCAPEVRAAMSSVLSRRAALREAFASAGPLAQAAAAPALPRYARVNTLKASVDAVERELRDAGHTVARDPHVPALLALPPGTDVHAHPLVCSGALILQDKASCMPVVALGARAGWACIDACAAPGNKTTQLAAAVGAAGRVHAWERDARRAALLERRVGEAAAGPIVRVHGEDFLGTRPLEWKGVRALLVDPSCSGSGIVGRVEASAPPDGHGARADAERADGRLAALSAVQLRLLTHALRFPSARVVVYSTCSVHHAENEAVVDGALRQAAPAGWRLADALPTWPRRGEQSAGVGLSAEQCALCVRCLPEDGTNGFFVARFERSERAVGHAAATAAADAHGAGGRALRVVARGPPVSGRRRRASGSMQLRAALLRSKGGRLF